VSEVDDQLKRFVVEWLESQKDMVDQQITVHVQDSATGPPHITWYLHHMHEKAFIEREFLFSV